MNAVIKALLDFVAAGGWPGILKLFIACVIIIATGLTLTFAVNYIKKQSLTVKEFVGKIFNHKASDKKPKQKSFKQHSFFEDVDTTLLYIQKLDIPDMGRRLVFQDLLNGTVQSLAANVTHFVNTHAASKIDSMSLEELNQAFCRVINSSERDWEAAWVKTAIPAPAISVYRRWIDRNNIIYNLRWHLDHAARDGFMTPSAKVSSFLTACEEALVRIQFTGWDCFNELNGELDNLEYRGYIIAPKHIPHISYTTQS